MRDVFIWSDGWLRQVIKVFSSDVEELITHLGREDVEARRDALEQLEAQIPFREKQIAAALVAQLDSGGHFVRQAALELFGRMGEQALEVLVNDGLNTGNFFLQRVVMDAIGRISGGEGKTYLVKGLTSPDHYVRWQAAKGLGKFSSDDSTTALSKALYDPNSHVRDRAAESLMRHGPEGRALVENWKPRRRARGLRKKFRRPAPKAKGESGVVVETSVAKESGYLYYLGKDGDVWRTRMARGTEKGGGGEKVAEAGVKREPGWLYYIDKEGNVARTLLKRGG